MVQIPLSTFHDGFTLYDLYSYNEKHNEPNGWNNTDGSNDNRSWNCGIEGETEEKEVLILRFRLMRNACMVLMCSRGIPMFFAGDEFCNTQYGNNNAYCQDNPISWLDWSLLEKNKDFFEFFKQMIRFRKEHTIIRKDLSASVCGFSSINIYTSNPPDNQLTHETKWIGILYAGHDEDKDREDLVYLALNVYWEDQQFSLPNLSSSLQWFLYADTSDSCFTKEQPILELNYTLKARSAALFFVKE